MDFCACLFDFATSLMTFLKELPELYVLADEELFSVLSLSALLLLYILFSPEADLPVLCEDSLAEVPNRDRFSSDFIFPPFSLQDSYLLPAKVTEIVVKPFGFFIHKDHYGTRAVVVYLFFWRLADFITYTRSLFL